MPNIELIRLLLGKIAEELGMRDRDGLSGLITFVKDRPGHDRRYAIDPAKIMRELEWRPETSLEDGITKTIRWYIDNRKWWEKIISGEYMKYYDVQYGERLGR